MIAFSSPAQANQRPSCQPLQTRFRPSPVGAGTHQYSGKPIPIIEPRVPPAGAGMKRQPPAQRGIQFETVREDLTEHANDVHRTALRYEDDAERWATETETANENWRLKYGTREEVVADLKGDADTRHKEVARLNALIETL